MNSLFFTRHVDLVFKPPFKRPFAPIFVTLEAKGLLIEPGKNSGSCAIPTIWVSQVEFQEMILECFSGVFQIRKNNRKLELLKKFNHRLPVYAFIKCQRLKSKNEPSKTWCSRVVLRGWMIDDNGNLLIHINPKLKVGRARFARTKKRHFKKRKGKPPGVYPFFDLQNASHPDG